MNRNDKGKEGEEFVYQIATNSSFSYSYCYAEARNFNQVYQ
jgi:hypothetical protein